MVDADTLRVSVLDVGQGSGNFFEMIVGGKVVATALIDLGSERAKTEAGGPAVDYIVDALEQMAVSQKRARIDFIALTHSDSDHINLILSLLSHFDPPSKKKPSLTVLEVGYAVFGGPRVKFAKDTQENVLDALARYQTGTTTKIVPLTSNACTFYGTGKPLAEVKGVEFHLVVGNHLKGVDRTVRKKIPDDAWQLTSYSLNTYSLILDVRFKGVHYVVTGDATGATISTANEFIKHAKVSFANTVMLTMPHHASLPTTFGLTSALKRSRSGPNRVPVKAQKNVEDFADNIQALTIHASAEDDTGYEHPSAYVMSYFWKHVNKTGWYTDSSLKVPGHYYNAFFDMEDNHEVKLGPKRVGKLPPFDDWWTFASDHAIFTNRYYVRPETYDPDKDQTALFPPGPATLIDIPTDTAASPPAFAVIWVYTTQATKTTVNPATNRDALAAMEAQPAYFTMLHPPGGTAEQETVTPAVRTEGHDSVRLDAIPAQPPAQLAQRFPRVTRLA